MSNDQVNLEEVNSCHDHSSRVTVRIVSAKVAGEGEDLRKGLQCTVDSTVANHDNPSVAGAESRHHWKEKDEKKKKKDKDEKRKRDDPEHLKHKRLKKEKK
ncbi:hypothetical protein CDL15_Pgr014662 [Punica granatum]|uniref:Uncharacterized protein n=1 Tax=Punica granatum TaxID=22663 RepID=A0A218XZX8_PUNGR|nr:hypothetical protein CDL15_Pgr014662 [Punica granatum]